ncbi:hypothetical protein E2C01_048938 [Portunus trituberculatus]|uniref:Uncharacterized protein n=1 Tax=Portunus trituberculatus TaxID=210409 RepID=A0A5B7GCH1_PORTR|nr:hypothetical protein [Portunus trituberculatus]
MATTERRSTLVRRRGDHIAESRPTLRDLSFSMDSEDETLALLLLLRRRCRRRRQRAQWMHSITTSRLTNGQFYAIMGDLKADSAKFFNYFRMSQKSFNEQRVCTEARAHPD